MVQRTAAAQCWRRREGHAIPFAPAQGVHAAGLGDRGTRPAALVDAAGVVIAGLQGGCRCARRRAGLHDRAVVIVAHLDDRGINRNGILRDAGDVVVAGLADHGIGEHVGFDRLARRAGIARAVSGLPHHGGDVAITGLEHGRVREIALLGDRSDVVVTHGEHIGHGVIAALDDGAGVAITELGHTNQAVGIGRCLIIVRIAGRTIFARLDDGADVGITGLADAGFVEAVALADDRRAVAILEHRRILCAAFLIDERLRGAANLNHAGAFIAAGLLDIAKRAVSGSLLLYHGHVVGVRLLNG